MTLEPILTVAMIWWGTGLVLIALLRSQVRLGLLFAWVWPLIIFWIAVGFINAWRSK